MKPRPTLKVFTFFCLIVSTFTINYSCNEDEEFFHDNVVSAAHEVTEEERSEAVEKDTVSVTETTSEDQQEFTEEDRNAQHFETRTSLFPPIHDAHLQEKSGFNLDIVRLEEGRRVSYIKFDLSKIDSIGGIITESYLEFTISTDDGHGTISIFKCASNDWSESQLGESTAPEPDSLLGQISAKYRVGQIYEVSLDTALIRPEIITLALTHDDGNDLAFASKENSTVEGPALIVTYKAPTNAEAIRFEDEVQVTAAHPSAESNLNPEQEGTKETEPETKETEQEVSSEEGTENEEETSENTQEANVYEGQNEEESAENTQVEEQERNTDNDDENKEDSTSEEVATSENSDQEDEAEESQKQDTATDVDHSSEDDDMADENQPETESSVTKQNADNENNGTPHDEVDKETEEVRNSDSELPQNKEPIAVAEASPKRGTGPLRVTFNGGNSTDDYGIEKYVWDFRDGSTSYEVDPVHNFDKTGALEVRLTVTDDQGETHTDTVTIVVEEEENQAPVAVVEASTIFGEAPLKVQFAAGKSNDDGKIQRYGWDFKDGATSTKINPSHTFDEPGNYEVALTVTDDNGLKDSETLNIIVNKSENQAPVAKALASPSSGYAPLTVDFKGENSEDDKGVIGYFWDFKDGSTTTDQNPSHIFSDPGDYQVQLSVRDEAGETHNNIIEINVGQRPVEASGNSGGDENNSGDSNNGGDGGDTDNKGSNNDDNNGNLGNYPSNAVFASSFGFKSGDATDALESALKSGNSYVVVDKQSSDWIIRPLSLFNLSNMTIVFESGVTLRAKSGAFNQTNDQLFQLIRANNVTIEGYGATFKMNKNEYSGGEHRHALAIVTCKNVTVRGLTLQDSGGDGISISGMGDGSYSEDITIEDVVAENNRRLGMGIISAQNVWVRNSEFSNTRGTLPEAGVDLEPNYSSERLVNINFINCKFSNNASRGFFLSTGKLNSSSQPISVRVSNCEFMNNAGSPYGNRPGAEVVLSQGSTDNPVKGEIAFEGTRFNGSNNRILFSKKSAESYTAVFRNCTAKDVAKNTGSVISLEALSTVNTLGGFVFDNFDIQFNSDATFMEIGAPSSGLTLKDIKGDFSIRDPNDNPLLYKYGYNPSKNVNVSIDYQHY